MATHEDVVRALTAAERKGWEVLHKVDRTIATRGTETVTFWRDGQRYITSLIDATAVSFETALGVLAKPAPVEPAPQPVAEVEPAKPARKPRRKSVPAEPAAEQMVAEGSPVADEDV